MMTKPADFARLRLKVRGKTSIRPLERRKRRSFHGLPGAVVLALIASVCAWQGSMIAAAQEPTPVEGERSHESMQDATDDAASLETENERLVAEREKLIRLIDALRVERQNRASELEGLSETIDVLNARLSALTPRPLPKPKRLIHWQHVGWSQANAATRNVGYYVATKEKGYEPLLKNYLRTLYQEFGHGSFDVLLHNPGGTRTGIEYAPGVTNDSGMFFDQMERAKLDGFAYLADGLVPLGAEVRANGGDLIGYIGFPLCDCDPAFTFTPDPAHCAESEMRRWYGALLDAGVIAIGHDFTSALPEHSRVLDVNFRWLREQGVEPYIEANPKRNCAWMLGYSTIAETRLWAAASRFTEEEIRKANPNAVCIHYVRNGTDNEIYDETIALLREGKTVAVSLLRIRKATGNRHVRALVDASRSRVGDVN